MTDQVPLIYPKVDVSKMSDRIRALPRDPRGYPIPWFVHRGDYRIVAPGKVEQAIALNLCFICGHSLAKNKTFVVGPLACVGRSTADAPCHRSCAMYAATTCPHLVSPRMRKRTTQDAPPVDDADADLVMQNPGVCCLWTCHDYRTTPTDSGLLFRLGDPVEVRWFCRGKPALRREVVEAIDRGLPILIDEAKEEGDDALRSLLLAVHRMRQYLPVEGENGRQQGASTERRTSAA